MAATVQKIEENVFLISWTANNPIYYGQPSYSNVHITEISRSCRLSLTSAGNNMLNLELEMEKGKMKNPSTKLDNKLENLKPKSLIMIFNGVQQPMQLRNSKWTASLQSNCACGQYYNGYNVCFNILISFNSTSRKTRTKQHVLDHLSNLWKTKTLTDVTFKFAQENDIKAHTLIIASGSPVLATMFQSDFKEKQERIVVIKDAKSSVFEKMLHFFYIGKADLNDVDVADLLILANKYGVDSLKEECGSYMKKNLSVDNAINYLVVSHLHESPTLYKSALKFISKNAKAIVTKKEWVDLMKHHHELSLAAVQMIVLNEK